MRYKLLCTYIFIIIFSACSSSDSDNISFTSKKNNQGENEIITENEYQSSDADQSNYQALESKGLAPVKQITKDGDTGYLAEDENGKPYLILQGSSYNIGYQMGALMSEGIYLLATEYSRNLASIILKIPYENAPGLFNFLINEVMIYCKREMNNGIIPGYLLDEMQGVADGAKAEGWDIDFDDILFINMGIDAIYSFFYTGILPSMERLMDLLKKFPHLKDIINVKDGKVHFPKTGPVKFGCNEFVISGNATTDGSTFHGRDFMYETGGIYQDIACMGVYIPDDGYPFSCVTAPGWIGQVTALNSHGLSMGVDVVMGAGVRTDPGMGCMLVIRDIIQYSMDIDEAIDNIKMINRSVPWLYILADDNESELYTNGVVVESGRSDPSFTGPDLLPAYEYWILSGAPVKILGKTIFLAPKLNFISRLEDQPLPDRGIMLRDQAWEFPDGFEGIDITFLYKEKMRVGIYFPEQMEIWPDVVFVTNHYIIPRMRFTSLTPMMVLMQETVDICYTFDRYENLEKIFEMEYGSIDFNKAQKIIDFLNPNSEYNVISDRNYYEPGGEIEGHHAIIDNSNLVMKALFGYYGPDPDHKTPWAEVNLNDFIGEGNGL